MKVHLVDGTYELFRQYFGQPPRAASDGAEIGAVRGVVLSILRMIEEGATHIGVATDHTITSFRNDLWPGYKDGSEVTPLLVGQFEPLEVALAALGIVVWPMVDLEADDALASAARTAEASPQVDQVIICTPDKDLSQCVIGERVVQLDRRSGVVRDEAGVWERFGVGPSAIPEWLALVGDSADGFPGLEGWGPRTAATVLAHYGTFDEVPDDASEWATDVRAKVRGADRLAATLSRDRDRARLFRTLATLRGDVVLFAEIDELRWTGPTADLARVCEYLRDPSIAARAARLASG
jgi:5'-3' exonuclease